MQDATEREIVYAYRHLARKLHPDLHPDDPGAAERFRAVQDAYDTLTDPAARQRHDAALAAYGVVPPGVHDDPVVERVVPGAARWPAGPPGKRSPWWAPPVYGLGVFIMC